MCPKQSLHPSFQSVDEAVTVVGFKGWIFLGCSFFLFIPILLWAFLGQIPISVAGRCLFFSPQSEQMQIYGFVPFLAGQSIHEGMEVECSIDAVEISEMVKATVKTVLPFPVDMLEPHVAQIPSNTLKSYLLQETEGMPLALVIAEPLKDPQDPLKFVGTYGRISENALHSGNTGTMVVTVNKVTPISYVIPSFLKE